jgi:hypothetical protein
MLRPPILLYCFGVGDKLSAKIGTILHGRQKQPRFDKSSMFFCPKHRQERFFGFVSSGKTREKEKSR